MLGELGASQRQPGLQTGHVGALPLSFCTQRPFPSVPLPEDAGLWLTPALENSPRNIFRESCEILSIFLAKVRQWQGWNVGEVCLHVFTLNNLVGLGHWASWAGAPAGIHQLLAISVAPWIQDFGVGFRLVPLRLPSWENQITS